jgi:hypothetical protein
MNFRHQLKLKKKSQMFFLFFIIKEIYLLMVNHYKIFFLHELMKKIELMFVYHFLIHYVFELDNDVEHYLKKQIQLNFF